MLMLRLKAENFQLRQEVDDLRNEVEIGYSTAEGRANRAIAEMRETVVSPLLLAASELLARSSPHCACPEEK
jgi:hypothetical protein